MPSLATGLAFVAAALAICGSVFQLAHALFALRAKERLRYLLAKEAESHADIRALALQVVKGRLNWARASEARRVIEHVAQLARESEVLNEADYRLLGEGLRQASTSGEQRYIRELLMDAAAAPGGADAPLQQR